MRRIPVALAWLCAVTVVVGFFLPWARLDLREPEVVKKLQDTAAASGTLSGLAKDIGRITASIRRGAQTVLGDLPTAADIPKEVTGAAIPQLANQDNAKVAVALFEFLTNQRQDIGWKSYAVYLLPLLALCCALCLTFAGRRMLVALGTAVVCAAVAAVGFWKLLTTPTEALFIAITIGPGLWMSLWAYVGLALAAIMCAFPRRTRA